jgi:hypothetical protein
MRLMRSGRCARAASGHATAAPPSSVTKSRRCMSDSKSQDGILAAKWSALIGLKPASRLLSSGTANVSVGSN